MKYSMAALMLMGFCLPLHGVTLEWADQFGSTGFDNGYGVSSDSMGNVYVTGSTDGSLSGSSGGGYDAYLRKYDSYGNQIWSEQLGSVDDERSYGLSVDTRGNIYITGSTQGDLNGPNAGGWDAFLSKYDTQGDLLWTEQLGSVSRDDSYGVITYGLDNVYITGSTGGDLGSPNAGFNDAFISNYDASGSLIWTEQIGSTASDFGSSVTVDALGNIFITGSTSGDLDGSNAGLTDTFVSKYDSTGNLIWTEQMGSTGVDTGFGISSDGHGNVYVTGWTHAGMDGFDFLFNTDAFLSKYDTSGNLIWTERLSSLTNDDIGNAISVDAFGNVYIAGQTGGDLGGDNAGSYDAFVSKYDTDGEFLWTEQIGSTSADQALAVYADSQGNFYLSGRTFSDLYGVNAGSSDAFVAKFSELIVPEPGTSLLIVMALATCGIRGRR